MSGNIRPAATTLANRMHQASLMTVTVAGTRLGGGVAGDRSDMATE
jgi:hypothetical protein